MCTRNRVLSFVAITALLAGWSGTRAAVGVGDAVMEWNQIALDATTTAGQGPIPQVRSMTIVQVAVHDAVNTITRKYDRYLANSLSPSGASAEAAAIAAAHRVLVTLFQSQQTALDLARAASLASRSLTEANPGISVGESTAAAVLQARANDGAAQAQFAYTAPGAGTPGVWTPIGAQVSLLPGWGSVTPWVIRSASQYMPDAPPSLDSGRYARDYNEVKDIGSLTSTTRTSEQTENRTILARPTVRDLELRCAPGHRRPRPRLVGYSADVWTDVPLGSRCEHRLLGCQIHLQLLAAPGGNPQRPPRRKRCHDRRSGLDTALPNAATP